jgi:cobalt-zinc-cadmium efflux system protein
MNSNPDHHHEKHDKHQDHGHSHHHHHVSPQHITRAFIIGIILNLAFVITEAITGFMIHSLALLTDAGHNLSDVASLALVLVATSLSKKKATKNYTYGYQKTTILVALSNAVLLLIAVGAIGYEAVQRMIHPEPVQGNIISIIAGIGILINTATALLFLKDKDKDINVRGAYIHMASDAVVSAGVVVAGIIMYYTNYFWLDSIISVVIIVVIIVSTWDLLKDSLRLSLDGVPAGIESNEIIKYLYSLEGVREVHDLHIWAMSTTETALTVHLVIPDKITDDEFLMKIKHKLAHDFQVAHSTIQIEKNLSGEDCDQRC